MTYIRYVVWHAARTAPESHPLLVCSFWTFYDTLLPLDGIVSKTGSWGIRNYLPLRRVNLPCSSLARWVDQNSGLISNAAHALSNLIRYASKSSFSSLNSDSFNAFMAKFKRLLLGTPPSPPPSCSTLTCTSLILRSCSISNFRSSNFCLLRSDSFSASIFALSASVSILSFSNSKARFFSSSWRFWFSSSHHSATVSGPHQCNPKRYQYQQVLLILLQPFCM